MKHKATLASNKDLELWDTWHKHRTSHNFNNLFNHIKPVIYSFKQKNYSPGMPIPPGAYESKLNTLAYKALNTYDPKKSKLSTHIYNNLLLSKRFIASHQNTVRIPESRIYQIGTFHHAKNDLEQELNRPPTHSELAKHLRWNTKDVKVLDELLKKDLSESRMEIDLKQYSPGIHHLLLPALKQQLNPTDYNITRLSLEGKSGRQISKKLKLSEPKITRRKKHITDEINKLMGNK